MGGNDRVGGIIWIGHGQEESYGLGPGPYSTQAKISIQVTEILQFVLEALIIQ